MVREMDSQFTLGVTIESMSEQIVAEVAKLHFNAFSGYMNTQLGNSYVTEFLRWFQKAERAIALVAIDVNGKLIGYVVGAPLGYYRSISRDLIWVTALSIIIRPWLLLSRRLRRACIERLRSLLGYSLVEQTETNLPRPTMSLVAIGISPAGRGKGVGLLLMRAFEERARALNMRSMKLSVYPDNLSARHLYERCGWQPSVSAIRAKDTMYYFRVLIKDS